jgi:outer membrane protein assembly factor BamB
VVVFNTATGFVNVLDLKSGRRKIFVKVAGLSGSPTVVNDRVLVADNKGFVYEINPNNRAYPFEKAIRWVMLQLWAWGVRGPLDPPRGLERVAYFKDSNFSSSISSDNQDVFVLSVPLHKCSINSYIARNNPRTALDRACAFGSLGRLHSINRTDMELNWTYQTERSRKGSFFREPPLIFNNIAIIGDGSGLLHIIDLETGDHLSEYDLLSSISEPPVYSDGHVYIVTDNGVLHALPVEASLGLSRR